MTAHRRASNSGAAEEDQHDPSDTTYWLKVDDAAHRLGVHPQTLRRWIDRGLINAWRLGPTMLRVKVQDVDAMLHPSREPLTPAQPMKTVPPRTRKEKPQADIKTRAKKNPR